MHHFHTNLPYQKSMLGQIEWWVQNGPVTKNGILPVTTWLFWKFIFSLRASYKESIWFTNYPNVHSLNFCKHWSFIWLCFFPARIIKWKSFANKIMHWTKHSFTAIPAGMDASQMHLWYFLYSVSETSQRGLICKSLRRLPGDWLKMSPQRRLWDLSGFLRDVFELHLRDCNSWPSN